MPVIPELKLVANLLLLCCIFQLAISDCDKPRTPDVIYSLTSNNTHYGQGFEYRLVCVPGYKPTDTYQLICSSSGEWEGYLPHCEKDSNAARWWIPMIVVNAFIILIPCTVPRIYYHFFGKGKYLARERTTVSLGQVELKPLNREQWTSKQSDLYPQL